MGLQDRAMIGRSDPRAQQALRRIVAAIAAGGAGGPVPLLLTTADRVALPDPDAHRLVYDTDLDLLFMWDGATWLQIQFSAGADLGGTISDQIVLAIQGMATPPGTTAQPGQYLRAETLLTTPRSLQIDGDTLWVGESGQPIAGTPYVWCFDVGDPLQPMLQAKIDLSVALPTVDRVRDLAQDADHIYAACWEAKNVAIIDKATMAVVGWASMPIDNSYRVMSCASDGAGKLFAMVIMDWTGVSTPILARWDIAACLGQAPNTVMPEATLILPNMARHVRYGLGSLYLFDANFGTGIFRVDPVSMTVATSLATPGCFMDGIVAFGSLWAVDLYGPLLRLDPTTLATQASIALPGAGNPGPVAIELGPDGLGDQAALWVSDMGVGVGWSVDPTSNNVTQHVLPTYTEGVAGNASTCFFAAYLATSPVQPTPGIVVVDPSAPSVNLVSPMGLSYATIPASSPVIVWRPSGPANAPNVYLTWPEVIAAAQQLQGLKTIFIDEPSATIPPGDWDPGGYTILKGTNPSTSLTFNDARICNIFEFDAVVMYNTSAGVSPLDQSFQDGGRVVHYYMRNGSWMNVATTPFILCNRDRRTVFLFLHDNSKVESGGGSGPAVVSVTNPDSYFNAELYDNTKFAQGCWTSTVGAVMTATLGSCMAVFEDPQLAGYTVLNRKHWFGYTSPIGVVNGRIGDTYCNTNGGAGTTFWVKEAFDNDPNNGWVAK